MDSYTIEIRSSDLDISKINEKIYKLKQIINKINDSNQFLEYTKIVTLEDLEELNNSDNIFNFINIKNYNNLNKSIQKLEDINYNDNKIKERYINIFSLICSGVNSELNSYENKINNMPDILKKNICNNNILSKLNFERKNLEFCLSILRLYFSMEGYFSDEFYLSKDLNNIYSEVYTIGLEILNLRKIKEDELRLIYDEYINYKNILNLLNYYQKKKLIF